MTNTATAVKSPMLLTYKYRIKDKRAKKVLARHAIAVNQVWNYCVGFQRDIEARYRAGAPKRKWPSHFDLTYLTAGTSAELGIHSNSITEICRLFVQSRTANHRSPKFRKSFGSGRSLGWLPFRGPCVKVSGNLVTYLGQKFRVFGIKRRPIPPEIKVGGFVEDARGRWYIYFTFESEGLSEPGCKEVGIDLGLKSLATLSSGEAIPSLRHYRKYQRKLAVAQRSKNSHRVKAIHAKIANARRDQMHKATAKIAKEHKLIVVGNVNSSKLIKTRMAKSVLDISWYMFKTQLAYKASRHQAAFIEIDEAYTSRSCSNCGAISGPKGIAGLGIRAWECADCGVSHDRDVNAAKNILRLGQSALARADGSMRALS